MNRDIFSEERKIWDTNARKRNGSEKGHIGKFPEGIGMGTTFYGNWANSKEARSANSCDGMVINLQQASQLQFRRIQQKREKCFQSASSFF